MAVFHHHLSTSDGREAGESEGQGKRQGQTEDSELPKDPGVNDVAIGVLCIPYKFI